MTIVYAPCFLMFCEGGYSLLSFIAIDNGPYLVNLIGILYSLFLLKYSRLLIPDCIRNTVDCLVREDRKSNLDWFFSMGRGCRLSPMGKSPGVLSVSVPERDVGVRIPVCPQSFIIHFQTETLVVRENSWCKVLLSANQSIFMDDKTLSCIACEGGAVFTGISDEPLYVSKS